LHQAIAAGIELPYLLCKIAIENDVLGIDNYRVGIETVSLKNIGMTCFDSLRQNGNRLQTMEQFMNFNTTKFEGISFRDPLPMLPTFLSAIVTGIRH